MNLCFRNFQLISVDDKLIELYRNTLKINSSTTDEEIIKNIIFYDILEDSPEDADELLDIFYAMVPIHGFNTPGEYIEFQMHCILEDKLKLCKNCGHFDDGHCISIGANVYGNFTCQQPVR